MPVMAPESLGCEPLDSTITTLHEGMLIFISDQTSGQGEAIIHEILSNTNVVYNHPRYSRPVIKDLLTRSRYVRNDSLPDIFSNPDELTIDPSEYDIAIYDAFLSANGMGGDPGTILTALRQNLLESGTIGVIRESHSPLSETSVITDFADVVIKLSETDAGETIEHRFATLKNRYSSPDGMAKPIEFGTRVELDTTRQIS